MTFNTTEYSLSEIAVYPRKSAFFRGLFSAIMSIEYEVPVSYNGYTICRFADKLHNVFHLRNKKFSRRDESENTEIFI